MSPIQNNHFCQFIPCKLFSFAQPAWWFQRAAFVAGTISMRALFNNTTAKAFSVPVIVLSSPTQLTGSRLISFGLDYQITTQPVDNFTPVIYRVTRGADGSPYSLTSLPFTADSNHDTAEKCSVVARHRMELTITSPPWIDKDQFVSVYISFNSRNGTVLELLAAFANFYWRD